MRFDDSLKTVLSAETATDVGARAAWRQLVDLIGRGRVAPDAAAIARLAALRGTVPATVRAASARALAFATPPAALVALFGEDDPEVAGPVLRTARLSGVDWTALLPRLSPAGRSVLRHRRDLPAEAVRALEAFGATDFVLAHDGAGAVPAAGPAGSSTVDTAVAEPEPEPEVEPAPVARDAEAASSDIASLVARIDAFQRGRRKPRAALVVPQAAPTATGFRFETDAAGVIGWVDGTTRTPLVGLSLAHHAVQDDGQVDGGVAGAYRRRSPFRDARLVVGGTSDAAGGWRLSGIPAFDPATGRFLGYRGTARRPRADESAEPRRSRETSDSLRQVVHELRTPTNAIAGFAELIETELLGPVADAYRTHAAAIRGQASALSEAIDDLDVAARIEGDALELRRRSVALHAPVAQALADLRPLAALRGASVVLLPGGEDVQVVADDRALDRLVTRLFAALVSAAGRDETLSVAIAQTGASVTLAVDKPGALDRGDESGEAEGAPLLGTAFAMRLAGNLAIELGGALIVDAQRLTLRLPAAVDRDMGQASTN